MWCRFGLLILIMIVGLFAMSYADVPPEAGYTRVYLSLILEPRGDLSDYRFFIESGMQLEEIKLSDRETRTIDPKGGGARYNSATVYAIPKKSLTFSAAEPTADDLAALETAIQEKRVQDAVDLIDHRFSQDVLKSEADSYPNPQYRIARDEKGAIAAVRIDDLVVGAVATPEKTQPNEQPVAARSTIVAASLLVFGIVLAGLWLLRRKTN